MIYSTKYGQFDIEDDKLLRYGIIFEEPKLINLALSKGFRSIEGTLSSLPPFEILQILVENDLDIIKIYGNNYEYSIGRKSCEYMNLLLQNGYSPDLMLISVDSVKKFDFLIRKGATYHNIDAFVHAVQWNEFEIVKRFLKSKLRFNQLNTKGIGAIHYAAKKSDPTMLNLIKGNCQIGIQDKDKKNALHYVFEGHTSEGCFDVISSEEVKYYPNRIILECKEPNVFRKLLHDYSHTINYKDKYGQTLAHYCAKHDVKYYWQMIKDAKINIDIKDRRGKTARYYAKMNGRF